MIKLLSKFFWCFLLVALNCLANQTVQIRGHYTTSRFNPVTGDAFPGKQMKADFTVLISENSWLISCTNSDNSALWEQLFWDGTNTYSLTYYAGHFVDNRVGKDWAFASVSPSPHYQPAVDNSAKTDLFFPWLAYGFSPHRLPLGTDNSIVLPLPWTVSRVSLGAFGYKWLVNINEKGNFSQSIKFVRDTSLDLTDELELLRPELDYPSAISDRDLYLSTLANRKNVTNGFLTGQFDCTDWLLVNDLQIPKRVQLKWYISWAGKLPYFVGDLVAEKAEVVSMSGVGLLRPESPTLVHDYRFKSANRDRIFSYAEYRLQPLENWKSTNDPAILKEAKNHLSHGRRYDDLTISRTVVSGVLCFSLLALALSFYFFRKQKNMKKTIAIWVSVLVLVIAFVQTMRAQGCIDCPSLKSCDRDVDGSCKPVSTCQVNVNGVAVAGFCKTATIMVEPPQYSCKCEQI